MNKNQVENLLRHGEEMKFVGTLIPPLLYLWSDPKDRKWHANVAKDLLREKFFENLDNHNLKAGKLRHNGKKLEVTDYSKSLGSDTKPNEEELEQMLNGSTTFL